MDTLQIKSPKYSFVTFNTLESNGCCINNNSKPLPLHAPNDLIFQFWLEPDNAIDTNTLFNLPANALELWLEKIDGSITYNLSNATNQYFDKYRTGPTKITFVWAGLLASIKNIFKCNDCFILKIISNNNQLTLKPNQSNLFQIVCNPCYTTVLKYGNEEDYADFNYCNVGDYANQIRLYFYLKQPKYPEDKGVYRKSNGAIKLTKSSITKEFLAVTEYYDSSLHEKLAIALAHDSVDVAGEAYKGGISKSGDYDIGWDDEFDMCTAPAKFKVTATPYIIKNNNCGECGEVVIPIACGEIIDIYGSVTPGCADPVLTYVHFNNNKDIIVEWVTNPTWTQVIVQYSSDGITFGNDNIGLPASPRNLGQTLNNSGIKYFRIIGVCANGQSAPSNIIEFNTNTQGYLIAYTNNIQSVHIQLLIGNNNSAPSSTVYNGNYVTDPVTGTSPLLPAVNANVVLTAYGKTIMFAMCNGVQITPNSGSASWTGVNGYINISFVTN